MKIYVGNILFLDRTKTEGLPFKVSLFDAVGEEQTVEVVGGGSQRRIVLEGVEKFRFDLPIAQLDVRDLRGWTYEEGTFYRDATFSQVMIDSGNEYVYDNYKITPRSLYFSYDFKPKSLVRYTDDGIAISIETPQEEGTKIFVAYATTGWQWNNIWLEGENRLITISREGLLQLEISQKSQQIVGFPLDWGFFACYEGRAVCYYPVVAGL